MINVNLSSNKAKIEQELAAVAADYDEITKELRIADERYQRVQVTNRIIHKNFWNKYKFAIPWKCNEDIVEEFFCVWFRKLKSFVILQTELKHTVEHLHEEQERIVKIEAVKKSLEIEVKVCSFYGKY